MAKKTEYLLVDGYNIIFSWDELSRIANYSLANARLRLCDILCEFKGLTAYCIILVFDAHNVENNPGSLETYQNITVVFTKEAETADHYIERAARSLSRYDIVTVATSDRLEQIIIMSAGARRMTAAELWQEVKLTKEHARERYLSTKPIKKNPLSGMLDAETAMKLDALRFERDKD